MTSALKARERHGTTLTETEYSFMFLSLWEQLLTSLRCSKEKVKYGQELKEKGLRLTANRVLSFHHLPCASPASRASYVPEQSVYLSRASVPQFCSQAESRSGLLPRDLFSTFARLYPARPGRILLLERLALVLLV